MVYASWNANHKNIAYLAQAGVGLPAFPALVQAYRVGNDQQPLFGDFMAPPSGVNNPIRRSPSNPIDWNGMNRREPDKLARWHMKYHSRFEIGKYYTVIAGLLNVLAIYDAFAGPVFLVPEENSGKRAREEDQEEEQDE